MTFATRIILFTFTALLLASYGLGCASARDECYYIKQGMTTDPKWSQCKDPNSYGDKECHVYNESQITISGCNSVGFWDNRGGSLEVGADLPMQYRINANGQWKNGDQTVSGKYPSVWFRCK